MPTLPDKPITIPDETKKHLKIPEPFLESIKVHQNQMREVIKTVNRAIMPISPALPAIQRFAEVASEIRNRLQSFTDMRREFILPPPRYQMPRLREFPSTREIAAEVLRGLEERKMRKTNHRVIVNLSREGDLYANEKHRYPLQAEKSRLNLVRALSYQYKSTRELVIITGYKNAESLYKTIQAINTRARYLLKIKANLIDGRRGSGYKINPKIKFVRA